ncbi:hypothetical protein QJS04_geneDACA003946 [Acorus gramineus]|uniref:CpSecY n=1 Tax=Acorus gramineus TaxID=55184 RepID=A0AAV9BGF6_ACOGR|nr:hypothetical protein QJS04_geneDACA003946 [Acorus gramineus]
MPNLAFLAWGVPNCCCYFEEAARRAVFASGFSIYTEDSYMFGLRPKETVGISTGIRGRPWMKFISGDDEAPDKYPKCPIEPLEEAEATNDGVISARILDSPSLQPLHRHSRASLAFDRNPFKRCYSLASSIDGSAFDPLGINTEASLGGNASRGSIVDLISQTFQSTSSTRREKSSSARGVAAAIEDSSIDIGDFFKGPLPGKFLKLLGYLALSRLGIYVPLGGVNREAFVGNLDQNSLLSTLDSFSGGGIGRLGVCSLGIVPFINAQIVFQLLTQIYPKLQDLQKREGEAGRKKVLQYTRYASVGFAVVQAIGQVFFLRPYVNDFSTEWVISSVLLLTLGSVFTTYIGERISDLKLGNGTSLLIFTSIISYLPASFGRTATQAFQEGNYVGLVGIVVSFLLLVFGIVYVQEAERKIPLNYASRYSSRSGGLQKSAYLPFKVNGSGVMPIIFSTSSLALPGTLARFTGLAALKNAAVALNPGDPDDVSEQLKRQGASIPLVRPGKSTAAFIKTVLSRISVLGSAFLAILAAGPAAIEQITHLTAFRGFAGTSVLILVGCATDTARKVQAEIISQKYKDIELYDMER